MNSCEIMIRLEKELVEQLHSLSVDFEVPVNNLIKDLILIGMDRSAKVYKLELDYPL